MRPKLLHIIAFFALLAGCSGKSDKEKRNEIFAFRDMSELATVEYTISKVVKANDGDTWYKFGKRKIVLSVQGYVKAGIDLSQVKEDQVVIEGKNVIIQLPRARLINLSIPPEEIKEEVEETGFFRDGFKNEEKQDLLAQAENNIRRSVDSMGILKTAEENAQLFIGNFVKRLGYENVTVTFDDIKKLKKGQQKL
jgi:hypothetical protein